MLNVSSCLTAVFSKMKLRPRLRKKMLLRKPLKKQQMEKTTLGDIDALAALKEKLDAEKK